MITSIIDVGNVKFCALHNLRLYADAPSSHLSIHTVSGESIFVVSWQTPHELTGDLYSRQEEALRRSDIQITGSVRTIIQNLLNVASLVLHLLCVWI